MLQITEVKLENYNINLYIRYGFLQRKTKNYFTRVKEFDILRKGIALTIDFRIKCEKAAKQLMLILRADHTVVNKPDDNKIPP